MKPIERGRVLEILDRIDTGEETFAPDELLRWGFSPEAVRVMRSPCVHWRTAAKELRADLHAGKKPERYVFEFGPPVVYANVLLTAIGGEVLPADEFEELIAPAPEAWSVRIRRLKDAIRAKVA